MITQGLESDENTKYYSESNISNKELKDLYSFHNLVKKYSLQEKILKKEIHYLIYFVVS